MRFCEMRICRALYCVAFVRTGSLNFDRTQLFALAALVLLISVLGELALAVIFTGQALGLAAAVKALARVFTLVVAASAGRALFVLM